MRGDSAEGGQKGVTPDALSAYSLIKIGEVFPRSSPFTSFYIMASGSWKTPRILPIFSLYSEHYIREKLVYFDDKVARFREAFKTACCAEKFDIVPINIMP